MFVLISPIFHCLELILLLNENSRKYKFKSVRRDLVLLSINFMDENDCSFVYVVSKRHCN